MGNTPNFSFLPEPNDPLPPEAQASEARLYQPPSVQPSEFQSPELRLSTLRPQGPTLESEEAQQAVTLQVERAEEALNEYWLSGNTAALNQVVLSLTPLLQQAEQHGLATDALIALAQRAWVQCSWELSRAEAYYSFDSQLGLSRLRDALTQSPNDAEAWLLSAQIFLEEPISRSIGLQQLRKAIHLAPFHSAKARLLLAKHLLQPSAYPSSLPVSSSWAERLEGMHQALLGSVLLPLAGPVARLFWSGLGHEASEALQSLKTLGRSKAGVQKPPALPERVSYAKEPGGENTSESFSVGLLQEEQLMDLATHPSTLQQLATAYQQKEEPDKAIACYLKLLQQHPRHWDALYQVAQLYSDTQRFIPALYYYRKALSQQPKHAETYSNFAYVLFRLDDFEGAMAAYRQALSYGQDPQWCATIAKTLAALQQQVKRDLKTAAAYYRMALELEPGNPETVASLVEVYVELQDYPAAIQLYKLLLAKEPKNAELYNFLGYLYWQAREDEQAVTAYQQAIQLGEAAGEANPIAYNNLGVILLDTHQEAEEALALFERAVELKADYAMAWFNQARAQERQGLRQQAIRSYAKANELNELSEELAPEEITDRLTQLFEVA